MRADIGSDDGEALREHGPTLEEHFTILVRLEGQLLLSLVTGMTATADARSGGGGSGDGGWR